MLFNSLICPRDMFCMLVVGMEKKWIILISNNCPSCSVVKKILEKIGGEIIEKNVDEEEDATIFANVYGIAYEKGIPVPQVFLVVDDYPTYVYSPAGETEEMMEFIIRDRLKKIEKEHYVGKHFLIEDMKEIEIVMENGKTILAIEKWIEIAKRSGFLGETRIFGMNFYVDLLRLGKLVEKKFECLCFKNLKCPCLSLEKKGICKCGVFIRSK